MLTRILHNSPQLCTFVDQLGLQLSAPQRRHVINVADGLLVTDGHKTLAELQRQFVRCTDPSNIADSFRIAPWTAQDIRKSLQAMLMQTALQHLEGSGCARQLLINVDDSLAIKDPHTCCLEGVDWHYDHAAKGRRRQRLQNALAYLSCHIVAGDCDFTFAVLPYLRAQTVRRINRNRPPDQRLHFTCKYHLVRRILEECRQLIPKGVAVYVHTDAWYASARLFKYIRRQGWHLTARLRANRKLSGIPIKQRDWTQQHQRYVRVHISAADGSKTTYLVRQMVGRLHKVPFDVRGLVSRKHYRDRLPVYFASTDLTRTPQQVLRAYATRWSCELDNWYLKQRLGLGDFRLQSYEAIDKFCAVVHLSWAYIQWRLAQASDPGLQNPADVIRQHRDEHARDWLIGACQEVLASGSMDTMLQRFLPEAV